MSKEKKKYIKIFMRDKKFNITLPFEQVERILGSPVQLVRIMDDDGSWTGLTVNKSEIIFTDRDWEKEKDENRPLGLPEAPRSSFEKIDVSKYRPEWMNNNKDHENIE